MVASPIILLAIGGLLLLVGVMPIVLGSVALARINRSGGALKGRAFAIAAIVVGALVLTVLPLLATGGLYFLKIPTQEYSSEPMVRFDSGDDELDSQPGRPEKTPVVESEDGGAVWESR